MMLSVSAASTPAQQGPVVTAAGAGPANELRFRGPAGSGDSLLESSTATVQRRVGAIWEHLEGAQAQALAEFSRGMPASCQANLQHPTPVHPMPNSSEALQAHGTAFPPSSSPPAWSSHVSSGPHPGTPVPGYNPNASDPSATEPGRSDSVSDGGCTATPGPSSAAGPASGPAQNPEGNLIFRQYNALFQRVEALERQFPAGDIPPSPSLFALEFQFHRMLADRQRDHVPQPRALESEIQNMSARIQALFARVGGPRPGEPMYILADCNGRQYLVTPGLNAGGNAAPNHAHAPGAAGDPAAREAMFDDAARRLILNHQRSFMRRIWLLGRLWLLSYLLSGSGTWTRLFFVILSALLAIFMETHYPRRLYDLIIRPVQRHLEELTHMGRPRQPAAAQDAGLRRRDRILQEIWGYLRGVERSIVLLLASLIPGVGERQVEARNAAEAAAERARQEEQEREQGPEPAAAEGQAQNPTQREQTDDEQPQSQSQQVASGDQ